MPALRDDMGRTETKPTNKAYMDMLQGTERIKGTSREGDSNGNKKYKEMKAKSKENQRKMKGQKRGKEREIHKRERHKK